MGRRLLFYVLEQSMLIPTNMMQEERST